MNQNLYVGCLIGILLLSAGCSKNTAPVKKATKPAAKAKTLSTATTRDLIAFIKEKDVFSPPEQRQAQLAAIEFKEESTPPPPPVLQKLLITGTGFNGREALVSVENRETGDMKFLKVDKQLGAYRILNIAEGMLTVVLDTTRETRVLRVGDEVELPGTISSASVPVAVKPAVSVSSGGISFTSNDNQFSRSSRRNRRVPNQPNTKNQTQITGSVPSTGGANESLEERLRRRRQQQEEELK